MRISPESPTSPDNKKRCLYLIGATIISLSVIGCGKSLEEQALNGSYQTTTYRGKDLHCRVMEVGGSEFKAYNCDFEGYYQGNVNAPSDLPRIPDGTFKEIKTAMYDGWQLTCLTFPMNRTLDGQTCDFAGYHRERLQREARFTPTPAIS